MRPQIFPAHAAVEMTAGGDVRPARLAPAWGLVARLPARARDAGEGSLLESLTRRAKSENEIGGTVDEEKKRDSAAITGAPVAAATNTTAKLKGFCNKIKNLLSNSVKLSNTTTLDPIYKDCLSAAANTTADLKGFCGKIKDLLGKAASAPNITTMLSPMNSACAKACGKPEHDKEKLSLWAAHFDSPACARFCCHCNANQSASDELCVSEGDDMCSYPKGCAVPGYVFARKVSFQEATTTTTSPKGRAAAQSRMFAAASVLRWALSW